MDYLFTPWRYAYISGSVKTAGCLFCTKLKEDRDAENLIVHRGENCFVILNAFPYTNGHTMVVPYDHVAELQSLSPATSSELIQLTQKLEGILRELYRPDGLNLGMNLGKAAGAGVDAHIHMHVLPRWVADANFMTVIGETRVLPEALEQTYTRIKSAF